MGDEFVPMASKPFKWFEVQTFYQRRSAASMSSSPPPLSKTTVRGISCVMRSMPSLR
jgi:hypothetical protein